MFHLQVSCTTLLLRIHLYDFRPFSKTHTYTHSRLHSHARHGTAHSRVSRVCDVSGGEGSTVVSSYLCFDMQTSSKLL